jgi:hypothetical protein
LSTGAIMALIADDGVIATVSQGFSRSYHVAALDLGERAR